MLTWFQGKLLGAFGAVGETFANHVPYSFQHVILYVYINKGVFMMYFGCFIAGCLFMVLFDTIDYIWFDEFSRKKVFKENTYIYVLSDDETWDTCAHEIRVTDDELVRIYEGEPVVEVIEDETRWRQL